MNEDLARDRIRQLQLDAERRRQIRRASAFQRAKAFRRTTRDGTGGQR